MPEAPEIETMRRGLEPIIGSRIDALKLAPYKKARNPEGILALRHGEITALERHGKRLAIVTSRGILQVGAGMSGWWRISFEDVEPPQKHDILTMTTSHHWAVFNDARRFGNLAAWRPGTEHWRSGLGVDGLSRDVFAKQHIESMVCLFKQLRGPIKPVLMDQAVIAGIGNIYASEICHACGVSPFRKAALLTYRDVEAVLVMTHRILNAAADGNGTTIAGANPHRAPDDGETSLFPLQVYAREGLPCLHCGDTIVKVTQAGRATYHCPGCQT